MLQRCEKQVRRQCIPSSRDVKLTEQIVLVTHGAFAHFLTEDWNVEDPMTGTAWLNCMSALSIPAYVG